MHLYIVEGHFDYEGFTIMGIFDTEEAAKLRACEEDCEGYHRVIITKMKLNTRYSPSVGGEEIWKR